MTDDYETVQKPMAEPVRGRSPFARFNPAENRPRRDALRFRSGRRQHTARMRHECCCKNQNAIHVSCPPGRLACVLLVRCLSSLFHRAYYTKSQDYFAAVFAAFEDCMGLGRLGDRHHLVDERRELPRLDST